MTTRLRLLLCLSLLAFAGRVQAQSWATKASGTTQALTGVWVYDATNAWAVGGNGTILKWNGTAWQAQPSGTTEFITDVWGSSPTNIWATATNGKLLHYNGASWSVQSLPTTETLNAIWGYDADRIVVVGTGGVIFRWDGTAWNAQSSGTTNSLAAVSGDTPSHVWAVGSLGTVIKWNGTSWSSVTTPNAATALKGVYVANSSAVFVTSNAGLYRYNAGTWQTETTGLTSVSGVWGTGHGQVWVSSGDGKIACWNGVAWTLQATNTTKGHVDISGNALMNLWAVGPQGSIIQFTPAANAMFAYTFVFKPAGSAVINCTVGTTGKAVIEDTNLTGSVTVKLPAAYVGFKPVANPGFTLSTISVPQFAPNTVVHNAVTSVPTLDFANPYSPTFGYNVTNARTIEFTYSGTAEQPAGTFVMSCPPEGKATPVSSATGNFQGRYGIRLYDFDLATDETGKFTGVGTVEGMETVIPGSTPTATPDIKLDGTMATVSGKPTAKINSSFSGNLDSRSATNGTLVADAPFTPADSIDAKVLSGKGAVGTKTAAITNKTFTIPSATGGGQRSWSYALNISEKTDAKGVKYKVAVCTLTLPTGEKVLFPEKPVSYVAKTGYAISCTYGIKLDAGGNPILILNSKGVLITVPKTSLVFTGLKFTKQGANWAPSAGTVKYTFMGQTGTGNVLDFGVQ